ncbi:putative cell cycle control protein [Monocercomonoides exilis]|uniref:putative cell cycle control protein n=1 Tax=Monocercomonoides exilis TaxID=2049356 RepID=UPI00355AB57F|nr:putative cell cycle control protein [Monocercomonoides exilis]|eukprot:MONOS_2027.1-p1 / transcript=MONOS_2027.1 / gene=MONOS_2027 / organism=Monocercomonoides_exilis_PA203 / gene_product=cell cycle control protein / transcript_product=cell cycle control protein / location=Mono_scaffold00039:99843-101698(+) / protein_length=313 / sequence_SO=supercontig / SO=protein_coding / is_pseudo=false
MNRPGLVASKPKNWSIFQQKMRNFKPQMRPFHLVIVYGILFVVSLFITLYGFITYSMGFEFKKEYNAQNGQIEFNVELQHSISEPVFLYYGLTSFHTNHRRFLASRDEKQLAGKDISEDALKDCDPRISDGIGIHEKYPCGLVAEAIFNDTFSIYSNSSLIKPSTANIYPSYETKLFRCPNDDCSSQRVNVTDPHFINWMRPQPFANFRKLEGVFVDGMPQGVYTVKINENIQGGQQSYQPSLKGSKYFVLSTRQWMGKRSLFIPIFALCISVMCIIVSIFYMCVSRYDQHLKEDYLQRHSMKIVQSSDKRQY